MLQLIEIVGALAVLAVFIFAQFGVLPQQSWSYLGLGLDRTGASAACRFADGFVVAQVRTAPKAAPTRHADEDRK